MRITINQPWRGSPDNKYVEGIEVPLVPRKGDYLSHDPSGLSGFVDLVMFWWPEDKPGPVVEVRLVAKDRPPVEGLLR